MESNHKGISNDIQNSPLQIKYGQLLDFIKNLKHFTLDKVGGVFGLQGS